MIIYLQIELNFKKIFLQNDVWYTSVVKTFLFGFIVTGY